jgi:selenide, water dikinase
VKCHGDFADWKRNLVTDPQTSGGLLVACAPEAADDVLRIFRSEGFAAATKIGVMTQGDAVLTIR